MGGTQPWPQVPVGNKDHTSAAVVIIGAGISGMCMAIDLIKQNKCHNFIIVEKSSGVGGTWHDNKYPGCCCDVWSMLYSYSFEQNPDWTREYPGQEEILDYLQNVAQKYKLFKYIRFNTSVESAVWDDEALKWKVDVKVSGEKDAQFSPQYTINCDYLVSAVGQLNQPRYPAIPGIEDFKGKVMHSARWDWSYSLEGKRIGIIGNGATAAQIIPEILPSASHLNIYQRTPNWVIPRNDTAVSSLKRALFKYFPPLRWRIRALQMDYRESFYSAVTDGSSEFANLLRDLCLDAMHKTLPGREDLWEKLTPNYAPGCKRVIISDDYYPALASPKTTLETRPISRIIEKGIELEGGEVQEFDLLVLATGFRTVEFMYPIQITGAQGRELKDIWSDGAKALYGTCVEDMPNFGMFYGPNTNLGHNSIVLMIEAQSRYLNAMVGKVLEARREDKTKASLALVPKKQRVEAFNDKIQEILRNSSFADPNCNSWYKNEAGRITNNWSGTVVEYQEILSKVDWTDYDVLTADGVKSEGTPARRDSAVVFGGLKPTKLGRVQEETSVSNTTLAVGALGLAAALGGVLMRGQLRDVASGARIWR